jgi:cell division protein FtsN
MGFEEGKRQGRSQKENLTAENSAPAHRAAAEQVQAPKSAGDDVTPVKEDSVKQQLNWHKVVTAKEPSDSLRTTEAAKKATNPVTYSVQVGAFSIPREAEIKAKELRSRGFDCRIEEPKPPKNLYLLKVGKYQSRAEAVDMKIRLENSGFTTLLKTN